MATKKTMCLKLISGEELIADVSREMDTYIVENPIYLQLIPNPATERVTLSMSVPFMAYSKTRKFNIPMQSVVVECEPSDDLRNAYAKQHGSGIIIPEAPKVDPRGLLL